MQGKEVNFVVKKDRASVIFAWLEAACQQTPKCLSKNYTAEKCTTEKESDSYFFFKKGQMYSIKKKKQKQIINNLL